MLFDEISNKDSIKMRPINIGYRPLTSQETRPLTQNQEIVKSRLAALSQSRDYYQMSDEQKTNNYNFINEWHHWSKNKVDSTKVRS